MPWCLWRFGCGGKRGGSESPSIRAKAVRDVRSGSSQFTRATRHTIERIVGRVVEHLNLHPVVRIVERGHGVQQSPNHFALVEDRRLTRSTVARRKSIGDLPSTVGCAARHTQTLADVLRPRRQKHDAEQDPSIPVLRIRARRMESYSSRSSFRRALAFAHFRLAPAREQVVESQCGRGVHVL